MSCTNAISLLNPFMLQIEVEARWMKDVYAVCWYNVRSIINLSWTVGHIKQAQIDFNHKSKNTNSYLGTSPSAQIVV